MAHRSQAHRIPTRARPDTAGNLLFLENKSRRRCLCHRLQTASTTTAPTSDTCASAAARWTTTEVRSPCAVAPPPQESHRRARGALRNRARPDLRRCFLPLPRCHALLRQGPSRHGKRALAASRLCPTSEPEATCEAPTRSASCRFSFSLACRSSSGREGSSASSSRSERRAHTLPLRRVSRLSLLHTRVLTRRRLAAAGRPRARLASWAASSSCWWAGPSLGWRSRSSASSTSLGTSSPL